MFRKKNETQIQKCFFNKFSFRGAQNPLFYLFLVHVYVDRSRKSAKNHIDKFENRIIHLHQFNGVLGTKNSLKQKNTGDVSGANFLIFFCDSSLELKD